MQTVTEKAEPSHGVPVYTIYAKHCIIALKLQVTLILLLFVSGNIKASFIYTIIGS